MAAQGVSTDILFAESFFFFTLCFTDQVTRPLGKAASEHKPVLFGLKKKSELLLVLKS